MARLTSSLVAICLGSGAALAAGAAPAGPSRAGQPAGETAAPTYEVRHVGSDVAWAGLGQCRVRVEVAPVETAGRERDELPASVSLDLTATLRELGLPQKADLASIQVIRYDPASGEPILYDGYAFGKSPYDRPLRWYDASIPDDFQEVLKPISRTKGKLVRSPAPQAGHFYGVLGEGDRGRLAWLHTQDSHRPTHYAIYFDPLPPGESMRTTFPVGWLGDGMARHDRLGASTTGSGHSRVALDDWDGDGLIDIIHGEEYGCLFVMPNQGSAESPEYPFRRMLFDAEGLPLDVGMHAAPFVIDWDGDGVKDLLVGTYQNRLLFFRNEGTNSDRKLVSQGFVHADGKILELPITPVIGRSEDIFKHDYYPVVDVADWNGDGRADLIAGGYITGRIYLYENLGSDEQGQPRLAFRGPLEADGEPINVGDWCAAPCVIDLDGDRRLDLLSGGLSMRPESKDRPFLHFYRNEGAAGEPRLTEQPFPRRGEFPRGGMATPRAADLTGDGLLDLVVSAGRHIYIYRNIGSTEQPMFAVHADPLPAAWGNAPLPARQFMDWNDDGLIDLIDNYTVHLNSGEGNPYRFDEQVHVLPPGTRIAHSSGVGDDWFWPFLHDFTGDGRIDVLFGDWSGHIWLHRNLSTDAERRFDLEGVRLRTVDGQLLKVGPVGGDPETDFAALQGARTVLSVGDFDRDGNHDLVVGDTFGIVRYFRNAGSNEDPVFDAAVELGDLGNRTLVDASDWDGDGKLDAVAGAANGQVRVFLNTGSKGAASFDEGIDPGLPPIRQPRILMVDLNDDGDDDLFIPSTQGSVWLERSFLRHGYAKARVGRIERTDGQRIVDRD